MKPKTRTNHKDTLVRCLLCKETIDLEYNYDVGKFITCKNCEMVYEIVNIDPVVIDWPYYDDDYDDDSDDDFMDWS